MWYLEAVKKIDKAIEQQAIDRQNDLTKPKGSLGLLEGLATRLAGRQGVIKPNVDKIQISVFAGDSGIADEQVSLFPQVVTMQMVQNFVSKGAAITVLAEQYQADFEVIDVGVANPLIETIGVVNQRVADGTKNFAITQAMNKDELQSALNAGQECVMRAENKGVTLFIGGEMGIANTTCATAILCELLGKTASELTGAGTGLDDAGIERKVAVIGKALDKYQVGNNPLKALQTYGGFEIVALAGAYIACAQRGISILVDGFISTTAALAAVRINPQVKEWMEFSHQSAEKGHRLVLKELGVKPILDMGMRLGEGSGASVAIGIMKSACCLHNNMATFSEAMVLEGK
ncbi:MAG: nicotinate-nucleotide--dimethylbenzimidazole phosphoribosyltransferase [Candidatus Thiodubiliella endoseptemdiera]|uniref:Nicotinate-nucleotide--dimethylbenzimidazole phosphoribosyltransferase n=1 Tax=Candidatus Thiodubiliella endoseptemdiera TaxID=2738886 RepID=A0A853EYU2_9GAMM|nr:nicotinate-nucleotide--dimethylbenzimidazole phosphoribosyltransferase [Candidatus Thiodubiliella endoseptemdiera]